MDLGFPINQTNPNVCWAGTTKRSLKLQRYAIGKNICAKTHPDHPHIGKSAWKKIHMCSFGTSLTNSRAKGTGDLIIDPLHLSQNDSRLKD